MDSLTFGVNGMALEGLLFISSQAGADGNPATDLVVVEVASMDQVAIAQGGTRAETVLATKEGRLFLAQSTRIDSVKKVQ